MRKRIGILIETGGTATGQGSRDHYESGTLTLEKVLQSIDYDRESITLEVRSVAKGDGVDKTSGFALYLACYISDLATECQKHRPTVTFIGFIAGTDLGAQVMAAFSCLEKPRIPVSGTGAQFPPDDPAADGPGNIADLIKVGVHPRAVGRGAMWVFNHKIMDGPCIRKKDVHSEDAFDSYPGPIGHIDGGSVSFNVPVPVGPHPRPVLENRIGPSQPPALTHIKIETITHDYDGKDLEVLTKDRQPQAIIFNSMGKGYCNQYKDNIRAILEKYDTIAVICTTTGQPLMRSNAGFGIPGGALPMRNIDIILKICFFAKKSHEEIKSTIYRLGQVELLEQTAEAAKKAREEMQEVINSCSSLLCCILVALIGGIWFVVLMMHKGPKTFGRENG
ncbi:hypothetical protein FSARC_14207 [Fusarium sarcochroum]|uniref:L-asparaginase N-terminal domain-containing protein n=1 Tax=Fusarium sarcochroum TaxID=1208366 RepID=A0A8H4SV13_9HYPO|nr:hypothetical protein FSARC_14207 [Fusarium sarcochroum]